MLRATLEILRCPRCHERLALRDAPDDEDVRSGALVCDGCRRRYEIANGYPRFIEVETLTGINKPIAMAYDRHARAYLAASLVGQRIGRLVNVSRRDIIRRLAPRGRVLEVSIGPGVNIPYLREHPDVTEIHGLDVSRGQLDACVRYAQRHRWPVELTLATAEALPYADASFDAVLHIGGINFFTDKQAAVDEMVRVARPGAPVLIADETQKLIRPYLRFVPTFRKIYDGRPIRAPVDLLPAGVTDVQVETIWRDALYVLSFRTPTIPRREGATSRHEAAVRIE